MSNKAVVTTAFEAVGNPQALKTLKAYARRIKVKLVVLTERKVMTMHPNLPPCYEHCQLVDVLSQFERVLWVTEGTILAPQFPNVFTALSPLVLGAPLVTEPSVLRSLQRLLHARGILALWDGRCFSSERMLLSGMHTGMVDLDLGTYPDCQLQLNFNRVLLRIPLRNLGVPPHNDGE